MWFVVQPFTLAGSKAHLGLRSFGWFLRFLEAAAGSFSEAVTGRAPVAGQTPVVPS